jgi:DNA helicase HerA-like ATPase
VYFCSQNPDDVPNEILGQLGNRIQHALRAFTPRDQKAVRTAAETFVPNPGLNVVEAISRLGVGEALVSTLQDKGIPMPVEQTLMAPPRCRMGSISDEERATVRSRSPVGSRYDTSINRESAYEILGRRAEQAAAAADAAKEATKQQPASTTTSKPAEERSWLRDMLFGTGRRQGAIETTAKSAMRTVGNQLGRSLLRGVLGSLTGGKKR